MKTTVSLRPGTWQALSRGRTGAGSTLRAPERWQTHTAAAADALFDAGGLGYVTAGTVCARGASYPMGLTAGEKQVAALGSLLLFFPDVNMEHCLSYKQIPNRYTQRSFQVFLSLQRNLHLLRLFQDKASSVLPAVL